MLKVQRSPKGQRWTIESAFPFAFKVRGASLEMARERWAWEIYKKVRAEQLKVSGFPTEE